MFCEKWWFGKLCRWGRREREGETERGKGSNTSNEVGKTLKSQMESQWFLRA